MWLKKIRLLPLLVSCTCSLLFAENFEIYETKQGQNLENIAKIFNIPIEYIVSLNPEIDTNNKNFLKGEKLIIWNRENIINCPINTEILAGEVFDEELNIVTEQIWEACFEKVKSTIDESIFEENDPNKFDWKTFNSSIDYVNYLLYDLKINYCTYGNECISYLPDYRRVESCESACIKNWKFEKIFFEGVNRNEHLRYINIISNFSADDYPTLGDRLGNIGIVNETYIKLLDIYFGYRNISDISIQDDELQKLISKEGQVDMLNMPTTIRTYLYVSLLEYLKYQSKFDQKQTILPYFNFRISLLKDKKYYSPDDSYFASNFIYNFLNAGELDIPYEISSIILEKICTTRKCLSSINSRNEMWQWRLHSVIGNSFVAFNSYKRSIGEEVDYKQLYKNIIKEDLYSSDSEFIYEDYGRLLAENGKCNESYEVYKDIMSFWDNLTLEEIAIFDESSVEEPIRLALCFANNSKNSSRIQELTAYASDRIELIEISGNSSVSKYHKNLKPFLRSKELLFKGQIEDSRQFFYSGLKNLNDKLSNATYADRFILELLEELVYFLESELNTNQVDFQKFKNLLKINFSENRIINLKVDKENVNLSNLKSKFFDVSKKIIQLEQDIENLDNDELGNLIFRYEEKKKITQEIINSSNNIEAYLNSSIDSQDKIMSNLREDQFVMTFEGFKTSSYLFIYTKNRSHIINLRKNEHYFRNLIYKLKSSIGGEFNFEAANTLYLDFFSKAEHLLTRNSEIFIYDMEELNLPFLILSKNLPKDKNYLKNLISAEWLIKDFTFAKYIPVKKLSKKNKYQSNFLGISNSNSYDLYGLPDLSETDSEVKNLAMISNAKKENILIDNLATIENFKSKLSNNHEKIVISAHAVAKGWEGMVREAALLLKSESSDPFLTSSEIAQLNVEADMVVLSACNEGFNDFLPLYESFLIAGAESVVHSNWQLESSFANKFTEEFFRELWFDENLEKHKAIKKVALKFINDYSNETYMDPAYWGNFSIAYSTL